MNWAVFEVLLNFAIIFKNLRILTSQKFQLRKRTKPIFQAKDSGLLTPSVLGLEHDVMFI